MTNTTLGFPYPAATDPPAGHTQIQALADAVDLQPGVGSFTQAQITAFTAGEKRAGRIVWNSTTGTLQRCDGSAFVDVVLASGAQTLASKTLTTPTIGSMVNANHDHSAGAGGGLIPESSVTNLVSDLAAKAAAADLGLKFIAGTTFSAAASFIVNNCFTSTFDSYLVALDMTSSASAALNMRLSAGGAGNNSATYNTQNLTADSTTLTGVRAVTQTEARIGTVRGASAPVTLWLDIYAPALARITNFAVTEADNAGSTAPVIDSTVGLHSTASAFDGISCFPASGTITGTVRVYGYKNS